MASIPNTSGIYRITCTVTGKFYIGSTNNLRIRWKNHRNELKRGKHLNQYLQRAWNKYGPDAFTFEVLELILAPCLPAREQHWLDKLRPFGKRGFNLAPIAGSNLGYKRPPTTPETRERMRNSHLGKKPSQPPPSWKGRTHRPESIEKMRIARLGHPLSAEAAAINKTSKVRQMKTLIVTSPDGIERIVHGVKNFCREHNLDCSNLMRVARGEYRQCKGWTAHFPEI